MLRNNPHRTQLIISHSHQSHLVASSPRIRITIKPRKSALKIKMKSSTMLLKEKNDTTTTTTTPTKEEIQPPPRHYSSYNIFFQLERERILQELLNVKPELSAEEIFDASNSSYTGPRPLPSRYSEIILSKDWHVPGKGQRNRRRHRSENHYHSVCCC
jgi:hypothetical protein